PLDRTTLPLPAFANLRSAEPEPHSDPTPAPDQPLPSPNPARSPIMAASLPELQAPDLVTVATRVPEGVVCLISALAYHELTTQIPHAVDIALPRGAEKPRIDYPPVSIHWFSGPAFKSGIETATIDGQKVRIYSAEKSVADAFKYRNKLGLDVALEALKTWRGRRGAVIGRLLEQARVCRVERVMRPYLEAVA
ncbi:MAG TPA: hypothetical protein VJN18_26895, partial [Polyangiaceae bacterium]|nr:hypothetical protein [Polyangiaceae bacterium]